ncbi:MAG: hypothetical protein L0228_01920 [Planctomycetes bacterium]|nr:hypothetical protein [Planctomycetota bacterium]
MAATTHEIWRDVFTNWPAAIPRRGSIVSTLNETVPFKSFLLKGDTLLLERTNPDAVGTRFIVLAFDAIHMLKLTDPLKESVLTGAGYVGQLAKS